MKLKIVYLVFLIEICYQNSYSQKFDFGFTLTPLTVNKLVFDKPAIILNDFYSFDIGNEAPSFGYPTLLGFLSSGIYLRYNKYSWYLKSEFNYQTKTFRYASKSVQFKKLFFYYSCFEIPVVAGIRLNPENVYRFKIQTGINIEVGKFNHNSFVSPFYLLGLHINENKAMIEKMNPAIFYFHLGVGFDYYGISVDLRVEKNINNINKEMQVFNANFSNTYSVRLSLGFKISGKHWDKYRKTKLQLSKENV